MTVQKLSIGNGRFVKKWASLWDFILIKYLSSQYSDAHSIVRSIDRAFTAHTL